MASSAEQTTRWVAGNISKLSEVHKIVIVGPNSLKIFRDEYDPFIAGVISVSVVTIEIIRPILDTDPSIEIIANVPKESLWTGAAIQFVAAQEVAFGGISDLMSAVSDENVRAYERREYKFVERGLIQHDRVSSWKREFDRVYLVHRHGLPSLRFIMLNEYELTSDHVRTARCRYGAFDVILINNPNGKATTGAAETATSIGVEIFKWGSFLGRLNRR